jgi:hypothetical protein
MRIISLLLVVPFISACRSSPAPAASSTTQPVLRAAPADARSPLSSEWLIREQGDGLAHLTLAVTKTIATEKEVSVEFVVPAGVTSEPSLDRFVIPPELRGTTSREFTLRWGMTPSEDLRAVVDVQGTSFGYHADVPFRFGRPEPIVKQPVRDPNPVQMGNTNLGRPVDLTK